jgi:hypothetical protein
MANKRSRPGVTGGIRSTKYYGPDASVEEARVPWFGGYTHEFTGEKYTIHSPHGSVFEGLNVKDGNSMDEALSKVKKNGGIK